MENSICLKRVNINYFAVHIHVYEIISSSTEAQMVTVSPNLLNDLKTPSQMKITHILFANSLFQVCARSFSFNLFKPNGFSTLRNSTIPFQIKGLLGGVSH